MCRRQPMRLLARRHTIEQGWQLHQPPWDYWTRPSHSRISIAKGQLHQLYWLPPWWYPNECSRQCLEPPWDHGPWSSCSWLSFASLVLCCSSWIPCGWHWHDVGWQPLREGAPQSEVGKLMKWKSENPGSLEKFHILKKLQSIPDFAVCFQEGAPVPAMAAQAAPAAAPTPVAAAFVGASVPWQEFPWESCQRFPKFQEMSGNVASFAKLKSLKAPRSRRRSTISSSRFGAVTLRPQQAALPSVMLRASPMLCRKMPMLTWPLEMMCLVHIKLGTPL